MRPWNWFKRAPKSSGENKSVSTTFDVEDLESRTVLSASPVLDTLIAPSAHVVATQTAPIEAITADVVMVAGFDQFAIGLNHLSNGGMNTPALTLESLFRSSFGRSNVPYDTAMAGSRTALFDGSASLIAPPLGALSAWAGFDRQLPARSAITTVPSAANSAPTDVTSIAVGPNGLTAQLTTEKMSSLPIIAVTLSDGRPIVEVTTNISLPVDENGEQGLSAEQLATFDEPLASETDGNVGMKFEGAKHSGDNILSLGISPSRFNIVRQPDNTLHHHEDTSTEFVSVLDACFSEVGSDNGGFPYLMNKEEPSNLVDAHAAEWSAEYMAVMAFFHVSRGSNAIKNRQQAQPRDLKLKRNSPE